MFVVDVAVVVVFVVAVAVVAATDRYDYCH